MRRKQTLDCDQHRIPFRVLRVEITRNKDEESLTHTLGQVDSGKGLVGEK
jgi:hypothetical protein